jgi:hypothetical protein
MESAEGAKTMTVSFVPVHKCCGPFSPSTDEAASVAWCANILRAWLESAVISVPK